MGEGRARLRSTRAQYKTCSHALQIFAFLLTAEEYPPRMVGKTSMAAAAAAAVTTGAFLKLLISEIPMKFSLSFLSRLNCALQRCGHAFYKHSPNLKGNEQPDIHSPPASHAARGEGSPQPVTPRCRRKPGDACLAGGSKLRL